MHQYYGKVAERSNARVCKTLKPSVQIRPLPPNEEVWQSPVYCNSLENCRVERHREFESHRFRQIKMLILTTFLKMIGYWILFGISVATFLILMYGIAYLIGELAEW